MDYHYEPVIKITRGYQVTIPSEIRKQLRLEIGGAVTMREEGGKIILEPYVDNRSKALSKLEGLFGKIDGLESFADSEQNAMNEVIKEIREHRSRDED